MAFFIYKIENRAFFNYKIESRSFVIYKRENRTFFIYKIENRAFFFLQNKKYKLTNKIFPDRVCFRSMYIHFVHQLESLCETHFVGHESQIPELFQCKMLICKTCVKLGLVQYLL